MGKFSFLVVAAVVFAAGCATGDTARVDRNVPIQISYGTVTKVETEQLKSDVGKNTAVGGLLGLALGAAVGGDASGAAVGAAAGAALSGLTTRIEEGSSKAFGYTVRYQSGSEIKVVTDDEHLVVGDCVAVEMGRTTNVRRVAQSMCGTPMNHPVEQELRDRHASMADECHEAKLQLLAADTDSEVDAATKKVKVLCQH